jgi:hypothetical protein
VDHCLTGVYLTGVYLTGMHLMGVYVIDVYMVFCDPPSNVQVEIG